MNTIKGVIYARYSSDNQREESIEGQLRECKEYAEKNGITILTTYIDRAMSAKTDNRPEFQRMIRDSNKQLFDVVLVWKLDRFARNRYDSAHNKAILRKNGVKVLSVTERISDDSTGILLESLLEGYAEFYSVELSEKITRGLTENALKCKYNGGGVPLGYTIDDEQHFQIDPLTAPVVLEAFKRYSEGGNIKDIIDYLNANGITNRNNQPVKFDVAKRLLKNRRYIGEYKYCDVLHENGIPQIVPIELFERVGERLAKNKKAPARAKAKEEFYLLTTKLFCGKCGSFMIGESGTGRHGAFHQYYKCGNAKRRKTCDKKSVRKAWIEDIVVKKTMDMLMDDTVILKLTDMLFDLQKKENTTLPLLKKQIDEVNRGVENMLNAIQAGVLTSSTKQRLEELENRKSELEVLLINEEMQKPMLTKEQIQFWLEKFRNTDVSHYEQKQRLIDSFVNSIYLYDDKIAFTFNYKEGLQTLSLSDMENVSDLKAGAPPIFLYLIKNLRLNVVGFFVVVGVFSKCILEN